MGQLSAKIKIINRFTRWQNLQSLIYLINEKTLSNKAEIINRATATKRTELKGADYWKHAQITICIKGRSTQ